MSLDLKVKPEGHVFDIKNIHVDPLGRRSFGSTVDLPITDQTWWCIDALLLPRLIKPKLGRRAGSRSDHAHLSMDTRIKGAS